MYGYFGVLNLRWSMLPDILGKLNSGKLVKRCTMKNPLRFSTVFIQTVLCCTKATFSRVLQAHHRILHLCIQKFCITLVRRMVMCMGSSVD
jgi:hypothetical protein